jgi:hypothetical protein
MTAKKSDKEKADTRASRAEERAEERREQEAEDRAEARREDREAAGEDKLKDLEPGSMSGAPGEARGITRPDTMRPPSVHRPPTVPRSTAPQPSTETPQPTDPPPHGEVEPLDEETLREMFPEKSCVNCGRHVEDHPTPSDHPIDINLGPQAADITKEIRSMQAEEADEEDE